MLRRNQKLMEYTLDQAYAQLKQLENDGLIAVPATQETVEVGIIDPKAGTFGCAVPTVVQTLRPPPPPGSNKPSLPIYLTVAVVATDAVDLRLKFAVVPQRRQPVATARRMVARVVGGIVDDPFEWNGGVTISGFPTVSSRADEIVIDLGGVCSTFIDIPQSGMSPPITRVGVTIHFLDQPSIEVLFFILRPPVLGMGAFTIPALPVAIVYAPPQGKTKQNSQTYSQSQTLSRTMASSLTTSTSTKTTQAYSASDLIGKASAAIASMVAIVGTGGTAAGGASVVGALEELGEAVFGPIKQENDSVASALGKAKDELSNFASVVGGLQPVSTSSQDADIKTEDDHSVTLTFSSLSQYGAEQGLGPGLGDRIVYLSDVKVAWMVISGEVDIVVLGYEGVAAHPIQTLLQDQQSLAGGGATVSGLDAATIAALLRLDPLVELTRPRPWLGPVIHVGPPVVGPPRFVPASPPERSGSGTAAGGDVFEVSFETSTDDSHTTMRTQTTVSDVKPGWIPVLFGLDANQETTTVTTFTTSQTTDTRTDDKVTSTITMHSTGPDDPYDIKIFYDNIFGTFAVLDASSPLLQGTGGISVFG
jgi:hypothetical protein